MIKVTVFKIEARIKIYLYDGKIGRKEYASSEYRPGFKIYDEQYFSGQITLLDREKLNPGEQYDIEIKFVISNVVAQFLYVGKKITFNEGHTLIGEAAITKIIGFID